MAALKALTGATDVAKAFNTTGFENMADPQYGSQAADLFVAGDSQRAKEIATQLAKDAGFGEVYDFGGDDKAPLIEQFALAWINLAIMQGYGRNIAFKVLTRQICSNNHSRSARAEVCAICVRKASRPVGS